MTTQADQRQQACAMFQAAIVAADPARALRRALAAQPLPQLRQGRYFMVAIGKAACTMLEEALRHLPEGADVQALAVTNYENARDVPGCTTIAAAHPVPDENGLRAGQKVTAMVQAATAGDLVIALISGGGSALLLAPAPGITLQDKAEVNRVLLAEGFDITETNLIRQQLSTLKGGGMARLAGPAPLHAYILSDVIGDDLRAVASGPTVTPISTRQEALALLQKRGVFDRLPASVRTHLSLAEPDHPDTRQQVSNTLIGSNRLSLDAALTAATGYRASIVSDHLTGDVADAATEIMAAARNLPATRPTALIFGGETTVTLTGTGKGGRNQELALRFAFLAEQSHLPGTWTLLSGGTDGRDGPTDAAGGLVDAGTLVRIRDAGQDPQTLLANNDSYKALRAAGDLLMTGATGTNVADIQIFITG